MENHEKHEFGKVLFYLVYMWLTFKGEEGTGSSICFQINKHTFLSQRNFFASNIDGICILNKNFLWLLRQSTKNRS